MSVLTVPGTIANELDCTVYRSHSMIDHDIWKDYSYLSVNKNPEDIL